MWPEVTGCSSRGGRSRCTRFTPDWPAVRPRPLPSTRHRVDVDGLIAALTPETRLVVVATPNNPTGTATSTADLARLATAAGLGTIIVVDEAYREFDADGDDAIDELLDNHPNVVVTRTLSKAQGLAGLRIGYGVGHPAVIADIDKVALPFAVNALAQAAALAALRASRRDRRAGRPSGRRAHPS